LFTLEVCDLTYPSYIPPTRRFSSCCLVWIKALTAAASTDYTPELDYQQCCGKMNLDPTMEHNAQEINRAYRKKALEIHPDKGGKLADFKELKAAFNHLMARLDTIDEGRKYEVLEYEAVVLKGPGGMGIVVVEELSKELRVKVRHGRC
jgi:hypothetical protein